VLSIGSDSIEMAILDVPPEGLSVGGPRPQVNNAVQATPGSALRSAVILRLDEQLVQSLRDCAHNKLTVQLQCGQTPVCYISLSRLSIVLTYRSENSTRRSHNGPVYKGRETCAGLIRLNPRR